MLRIGQKHQRDSVRLPWQLLVFSVGRRRLAVQTSEVSGISQWNESIPVASRTPFVTALVRQGQTVLPVFDLAASLHLTVQGNSPLCLRVKHPLGEMAICIDEEIPVLHTFDPAAIQTYHGKDLPAEGSYTNGLDEIPILSVPRLGSTV
ncbi:MAG TPA: chemotaxis protein CheW [Nitrospira sp.]|nr:chemotaxis protein CheW [Nitrospira sp.]